MVHSLNKQPTIVTCVTQLQNVNTSAEMVSDYSIKDAVPEYFYRNC